MNKLVSQRIWSEDIKWHFEHRNPQVPYPLHSHNFNEIVIIFNGKGTHVLSENSTKSLKSGDIICVKPGQVHGYKDLDNLVLTNILIKPSFFTDIASDFSKFPNFQKLFIQNNMANAESSEIFSFSANKMQLFEIQAIIESMQEEVNNMYMGWEVNSTVLLAQLIVLLLRIHDDPAYQDVSSQNGGTKLIKYVEKNFNKTLTMQDLIENGNMSESTILRTFKRITGFSPFEYQMRQRMFAAVNKLIYSDWDITHIAYEVGFNDSNYFSRCFKKFINMTPRDYRAKYKKQPSHE